MSSSAPPGARSTPIFDTQLVLVLAILGVLIAVAWWRGGPALVGSGLGAGVDQLLRFGLLIVVSFLAAGLAQALLPREWIQGALGEESGVRGIVIASLAGAVTPAGPFVAMPIAAVLLRSGAAHAAVVAFVTGWAVLSLHRLVAWETPILGVRFAVLRWGRIPGTADPRRALRALGRTSHDVGPSLIDRQPAPTISSPPPKTTKVARNTTKQ